jgi:hypothetical protein
VPPVAEIELLFPCKLLIEIVVPLPPTPARVRTAASFIEIVAVAVRPSSVLTWLREIAFGDTGSAILFTVD